MSRLHASTRLLVLMTVIVAALSAAGCGDSSTGPSGPGQLVVVDLIVGTGATAQNGSSVTVDYTGWLYDPSRTDGKGAQFDSSAGRGAYPFVVGRGDVIAGFDQGVLGMNVGGQRRLTIPPDLAYGSRGGFGIPPNATLVFEITLVSVS
jgi:FKBP-type peptidyl-prolyl cis-trans isomerase